MILCWRFIDEKIWKERLQKKMLWEGWSHQGGPSGIRGFSVLTGIKNHLSAGLDKGETARNLDLCVLCLAWRKRANPCKRSMCVAVCSSYNGVCDADCPGTEQWTVRALLFTHFAFICTLSMLCKGSALCTDVCIKQTSVWIAVQWLGDLLRMTFFLLLDGGWIQVFSYFLLLSWAWMCSAAAFKKKGGDHCQKLV